MAEVDLYSLALSVDPSGAVNPLRQIQAELDKTGAAAIDAGQKAGQGFGQRWSDALGQYVPEARDAGTKYASAFMDALEQQFDLDQARVKYDLYAGLLSPDEARQAAVQNAIAYNTALMTEMQGYSNNSDAFVAMASSFKNIDNASSGASLGLGRIRQGLVSLVAQTTGTIPVIDRIGSAFGTLALGSGVMLGVLAGIAAVGLAYDHFTAQSRAAAEEQERLLQLLKETATEQTLGPAGKVGASTQAGETELNQLGQNLATARQRLAALDTAGPLERSSDTFQQRRDQLAQYVADTQKAYDDLAKQVQAGEAKVVALQTAAFDAQQQAFAREITARLGYNASDTAAYDALVTQLAKDKDLLATALTLPDTADNANRVAQYIGLVKQLEDAQLTALRAPLADIQTKSEPEDPATKTILDGLSKQLDEMRKVDDEVARGTTLQQAHTAAIGQDTLAQALFANAAKAAVDRQQAYATLTGDALTQQLAFINAQERQGALDAAHEGALKGLGTFQDFMNRSMADANKIAAENIEKTSTQISVYHQLGDVLAKDVAQSVTAFAEHGSVSWHSFFDEITSESTKFYEQTIGLIGQTENKQAEYQRQYAEAQKNGDALGASIAATNIARLQQQIEKLQEYKSIAGSAAAALAGGLAGYNIGSQTGSSLEGAGLGALSGGVQGFEAAGLPGAIAGAFGGVVGGLLGAAEAHKEAAKELALAGERLQQSLTSYNAGNLPPVANSLAQNDATFKNLQQEITDNFGQAVKNNDKGAALQAFEQLQQLEVDHANNAAKIAADFWDSLTQKINAASGPAGVLANNIDDLNKQEEADIQSAIALDVQTGKTGNITSDVAKITGYYDDALNKLNATYAESVKQAQYALNARQAAAQGDQREADTITRRAAEQDELFKDQQNGYTAAQLAAVAYVQSLEDIAAAQKRLTTANQTYLSAVASGPGGRASDALAADLQPLYDQQKQDLQALADDTKTYNDDLAAGADQATLFADTLNIAADNTQLMADAAGIAAKAFQDTVNALNQSNSDIENAVSGGFITGAQGLSGEKANLSKLFGFDVSGYTDDQLRALYADPTQPGGLTNQQRDQDAAITQYLTDENKWGPSLASAVSSLAGGPSATDLSTKAVSSAVSQLTSQEGNRIGDLLETEVIRLTEIRDDQRGWHAGLPGSLPVPPITPGLDLYAPSYPSPASQAPQSVDLNLNLGVKVDISGGTKEGVKGFTTELIEVMKSPAVRQAIGKAANEVLAQELFAANRRVGNNTVIGA